MTLLNLPLSGIQGAVLVFIRISAILFTAPLFSSRNVPVHLKVGLALMLAVIIVPLVNTQAVAGDSHWRHYRVYCAVAFCCSTAGRTARGFPDGIWDR
jgi:flagellar biosynthesis protein FliR